MQLRFCSSMCENRGPMTSKQSFGDCEHKVAYALCGFLGFIFWTAWTHINSLDSFSRKLDTWSVINETRGKITRHTVWTSSLSQFAMFEEIYRKRRDMKGKTFSWSCRRNHQNISTTKVGFLTMFLWFSLIFSKFSLFNPKFMASRTFILIPWSRVITWAGFQENDVKSQDGFWLEIIAATPPDTPPT